IDGEAHSRGTRPQRDAVRDAWFAARGIKVMRISARDVLNDVDAVTRGVLAQAGRAIPLHQPSAGPPPLAGEE
ncbi:MAG: DUF559 domain-containing protein, partial [Sphingomonadaceae bacterium]